MKAAPAEQDQSGTVAFLGDPTSYRATGAVERIDTHISHLFLVGDRVYKLKRAVRFPYLDFSTRAMRRAACIAEVQINRRTAPDLYLGVAPVLRTAGGFRFGAVADSPEPDDEAVDWVVVMRRFDQATLFDSLAARGRLTADLISGLAATVADFHRCATPEPAFGGAKGMTYALDGILSEIARFTPAVFDQDAATEAMTTLRARLADLAPSLDLRASGGFVRRGHGDLHLRNICLIEGRPTPFDAIEFNDAIATIDVLYDLAFLLMDLEHRGLRHLANRAFNEYLQRTGDYSGLAAMPFFLSCRAAIRAHVTATQAVGEGRAPPDAPLAVEARDYLRLAMELLRPAAPRLIAVGGSSGTGKTVLARALAPLFAPAPGAVHLRSDVIRKRLFGVDPLRRLGSHAYTEDVTRRVYEAIRAEAESALRAGYAVIADAVYARGEERGDLAAAARGAGVPFNGLWLVATEEIRVARVEGRTGDASDASAAVARAQSGFATDDTEWLRIDAGGHPGMTQALAQKALNLNEKSPTLT